MIVIKALQWLARLLEVPLMVTGVLAFFGFELNVSAARDVLLSVLPAHAELSFSRLSATDYIAFSGYVLVVLAIWVDTRFHDQVRSLRARWRTHPLYQVVDTAISIALFAIPTWFGLMLAYLVADLAFPTCAMDLTSAERCLDRDETEPWDLVIIIGTVLFILFTTVGAILLGAIQGEPKKPPPLTSANDT